MSTTDNSQDLMHAISVIETILNGKDGEELLAQIKKLKKQNTNFNNSPYKVGSVR